MSEESRPIRAWDGIRCARCLTVKSRRSWWLSEGVCWMCGYTNPVPEQVEGESTPPARRDHEREVELRAQLLWVCPLADDGNLDWAWQQEPANLRERHRARARAWMAKIAALAEREGVR